MKQKKKKKLTKTVVKTVGCPSLCEKRYFYSNEHLARKDK